MVKNQKDLLDKITDMLIEIGLALSRVERLVKLHPTPKMLQLTSSLYTVVVNLLKDVNEKFQRSPIRKELRSLATFAKIAADVD
jgi:hypothetical protein